MECPVRGVLPGEIVLTCADTKHELCIVAADISNIKLRPDSYTRITFKRKSVGIGRRFIESPDEVKRKIASI